MYPAGQPSLRHPPGFPAAKLTIFFELRLTVFFFFKPMHPFFRFFKTLPRNLPVYIRLRTVLKTTTASATSETSVS